MNFSHNKLTQLDHQLFEPDNPNFEWQYAGKCRVHIAPIRSVGFCESLDEQG